MHELTPQQKASLVFDKHISVTANAGSGKTFVLSKRFVEIYLNKDVELNSIVAITFTDKAAGELNRKIAGEVDERLLIETDSEKKRKLENLRRQLVSANISTIHSFCINILKEFAPEAGIDANFCPIDQATSDELIELSIDETINALIQDPAYEDDLKYLIRFFASKKIFVAKLQSAVDKRKIIKQLEKNLYSKNEDEIALIFKETFEKTFTRIFDHGLNIGFESVRRINEFVLEQKSNNETGIAILEQLSKYRKQKSVMGQLSVLSSINNLMLTKSEGTVRNRGYLSSKRDEFENEIAGVESLFADLNAFMVIDNTGGSEKELARFGKAFIKVYSYALNVYTEKKRKNGYLDFEDLLLYTRKVLELPDVNKSLSEKIRYVMIDEYQDTNELQYEIFMPILDHLRNGNLFVVGDEKQSIYLFRNAELEVFERTKNEINSKANGGELLNLPHSFRMSPPLVLFTNYLFSNLFKNPDINFNEVGHSNLVCAKDENENGAAELILADSSKDLLESDLVAKRILQLMGEEKSDSFAYKNIAVLCRKRDSFVELEESFVRYGIPFTIIGGKGFFQRQTIYDVYNYLSFLLNRENDAALIGILRSPFFNISDIQLYRISLEEGNSFFDKMENNSGSDDEIKNAYKKLSENLQIAYGMEIASLIRKLLLESCYWAVISAKENSAQELANIEKLINLARGYSKKSFKNLYDFTVFLREAIEGFEDEGQAQVARDENTVKMLTIHQAKGLEFKAVFLYGCNNTTQDDSVKAKSVSIDKNLGILSKVPLNENYFEKYCTPPIVALYNYTAARKNSAELKRLMYVGVTRAINYLFITATHKEFNVKPNSFLELLSKGLHTDYRTKEIVLQSKVEFMKFAGDKYDFYEKPSSISIPVINQIELIAGKDETEIINEEIKTNLTQKIEDLPKSEIISATKISMFTQCPVKYQLTYELGYSTVYNLVKQYSNTYEFNLNEDDELRRFGQLRGRLIHAALKEEFFHEDLRNFITKRISIEDISEDQDIKEKFIESIVKDLGQFYQSETYREIASGEKCKSEFEIYCEEGDHYLYGIIDKLIIEKDKLIIVDYKTDDVSEEQLISRATDYLPQLKFYAYILSKLFKEYGSFELRLIFLKYPAQKIVWKIDSTDLNEFGKEVNEAIGKIYSNQFKKNLNHCSKCHFAMEGKKCVKL